MPVMVGADIGPARRKPPRDPDGSLNSLFPPQFASSSQVLIDALPDQIGNRSSSRRRCVPKGFELPVG